MLFLRHLAALCGDDVRLYAVFFTYGIRRNVGCLPLLLYALGNLVVIDNEGDLAFLLGVRGGHHDRSVFLLIGLYGKTVNSL